MISWVLFSFLIYHCSAAGINVYPKIRSLKPDGDCGERLFLTPYIEAGKIEEGQQASKVPSLLEGNNIESYSGFLTIDKSKNSNTFFWFFPAETDPETAPLALWLQGGPGAPSVFAIFNEIGPFIITKSLSLKLREHYWSQKFNILYIDNPVGTGFSFTNEDGYVTNQSEVGRDLYAALIQFFQLFPEYQKNDFYVTGESYAGKYIPAISYTIHKNNPSASLKINLKGLAIGDGLVDPVNMMVYGKYLYQHGIIDKKGLSQIIKIESEVITNIKGKKFKEAFVAFDKLLNGDLTPYKTLFYNLTALTNYDNYVTSNTNKPKGGSLENWLAKSENRKKIHVGDQIYDESTKVEMNLMEDVMQSVRPWFETLMDNYKVLLYNGQLDIIVAYPLTMNYVEKLRWSGKNKYANATRKPWFVNGELAGYTKTAGQFTEILVRDAGHMVPADQPLWALDMITKFMQNESF